MITFSLRRFWANTGETVLSVSTIAETRDLDVDDFDLAILDINLPDGSGLEYLRYLRSFSAIPVLLLTVRDGEEDVLEGFRAGADDYITKPFSLAILKARVENVLRHSREAMVSATQPFVFGDLQILPDMRSCRMAGRDLHLHTAEWDVLVLLLQNRGLCLSREKMIRLLGEKNGSEIQDNTLSVIVKRLREKLGPYASCIHTVKGIGYRWEEGPVL